MSKKPFVAFGAALVFALAALPLCAQVASVRAPRAPRVGPGVRGHVFVPGFGLRPVVRERFPVFGLGFDAHHFSVLNRHRGLRIRGGFFGGFRGQRFFAGGGFFPFFQTPVVSSSSVVVIPQAVPVQVPIQVPVMVPVQVNPSADSEAVVAAGLPYNWPRLRIAADSHPRPRPAPPRLILLVLKDNTIFAVADYWLEDGHISYITSTGREGSIVLRDLDWDMTTQLNAERSVEFVLRSER